MNESKHAIQSNETLPVRGSAVIDRTPTALARQDDSTLVLKPASQCDEDFMRAVYASSRADEMALTNWSPDQQSAFLRMQFDAQKSYYLEHFPQAEYSVIEADGAQAGRLIVDRSGPELLLIDIALLSSFRQNRIGSVLMRQLMEEGTQTGKAIRLHVERFNPVLPWYQRLGFKTAAESAIYLEMVWTPSAAGFCELREAAPCN